MYEPFFALERRPFVAAPSADRFFPGSSIEAARTSLTRCIERAAGAGLVVGPSGTGKTMLLRVLAEHFRPRMQVALLAGGHLTTRRALLKVILFELGLSYRRAEEGDLRLALIEFLTRGDKCPGGLLLLIDEAHTLPLRLLEEVRMITNLARGGQPCVQLVLAGAPAIEDRLASPKMESLSQRLAARCYLEPLSKPETRDYVRYQVAAAGGNVEQIFTADALDAVYRATDGVPRVLNQVCDHALMLAYADDLRLLDAAAIERAWADLQQLPAPWVAKFTAPPTTSSAQRDILEFGDLDDEASPADDSREAEESISTAYAAGRATMPLSALVGPPQEGSHEELAAEWEAVSADSTFAIGGEAVAPSPNSAALERQPAEELDRGGLRMSRSDTADRSPGDMLHEEVVVDLYAELDAQQEQRAGRPAPAAAWTHSADPDWLLGLPKVKENSPEETLSLAEALLLREMAADAPSESLDSTPPSAEVDWGGNDDDAATPQSGDRPAIESLTSDAEVENPAAAAEPDPRWEHASGVGPIQEQLADDALVLPYDEADSGATLLLPLSPTSSASAWTEVEVDLPGGELAGETIPLPYSDDTRAGGELSFADVNDHDLIVVEDGPSPIEPPPQVAPAESTVAVVRPREYRQLFAKLRRG